MQAVIAHTEEEASMLSLQDENGSFLEILLPKSIREQELQATRTALEEGRTGDPAGRLKSRVFGV